MPSIPVTAAGHNDERHPVNASLPVATHDPPALWTELTVAPSQIVSDDAPLWEREDTTPYECGGLAAYRQAPLAVVLPGTEAQVTEILHVCHRIGVPVVPRSAGTSLSDGVMSTPSGLVLSPAEFKHIIKVNPYMRTAVVQPGVHNLTISEATNSHGLYYTPDLSSQIACVIGGSVNRNPGGMHCSKYGLTVHNVLCVHVVVMDGEIVGFGSRVSDAPGFDLLVTVIGSEGMLTVVTEVTVRLIPKPQFARMIMASLDDVESGDNAVAGVIATGVVPARLGVMDRPVTAAVEKFTCVGYDLDTVATLLCKSSGMSEEVTEGIARMSEMPRASDTIRIQVSQSEVERLKFWNGRKNVFPVVDRISPDYRYMDGIVPRKHIGTLLRRTQQMEQKYALRCINVFHTGDGNMHPLILFNSGGQDEWHRAELFGSGILETCVELGDTVTGEHGVGVEKLSSMYVQFSAGECDVFLCVKAALDPVRLLNPDRATPTLARCIEYGRLYVRNGLLSHPDLSHF